MCKAPAIPDGAVTDSVASLEDSDNSFRKSSGAEAFPDMSHAGGPWSTTGGTRPVCSVGCPVSSGGGLVR